MVNEMVNEPTESLLALSEEQRQLALSRFHLLRPHLEQEASLAVIAREAGVSYRTASRWVSLYRRFGLAALVRRGRIDSGGRRGLSPALRELVEGLALQRPPLPIANLYRQVCRVALEQNEKSPSYSVVFGALDSPR